MNSTFTFLVCCVMVLLTNFTAQAQRPSTATQSQEYEAGLPRDVNERLTQFFKLLRSYEVDKAYTELLSGSDLAGKDTLVTKLKENTKRAVTLYGNLIGHEVVGVEWIGSSLLRTTVLGLHNKYPMRYVFTFYKSPEKEWILTNIRFDDRAETLFSE